MTYNNKRIEDMSYVLSYVLNDNTIKQRINQEYKCINCSDKEDVQQRKEIIEMG